MSSLRVRCFGLATRLLIRRRDWGPSKALARRARQLFGAPRPYQWVRSVGVQITQTGAEDPPGEWLVPHRAACHTILYLHGGGYVSCSPATHRPITAALARLTPARVFAPAYRLAPEHPYPAALDDAERSYRWLLGRGISSQALALAGDSAGGGLALALLLRLRDDRVPLPACAVLLSPWTDLTGSGASVHENDGKCAMFRPENISAFAACYASPAAWHDPGVSPLYGRLDGLPPLHIQVGAEELLRDDAVRLHSQLQSAGGSSELVVYDGVFHGWHMLDGIVPEARRALARAGRFMQAVTGTDVT
jgi:monoterpene epsilon-lactone hydrolase